AWFDDSTIKIRERSPAVTSGSRPVYKGHNLPRLRGAMIGTQVGESDLRVLGAEWKANHVRWQLVWNGFPQSPADTASLAEYDRWLEGELARLDRLLPVCEKLGIRVLIDLHTPPGGRDAQSVCRLFQEERYQNKFLQIWANLARRYRNSNGVWGYDLLNEPVEGDVPDGLMDWQALAERTARLIRSIDTKHAIVVEPAPWGGPDAIDNLDPLPVPGIVYSVHMYQPFRFTHQGIYGNPTGVTYPGEVDGVYWDKSRLRLALAPVREFQQRYRVHVYVGEFSAIRWAPGESAHDYLRDLIDIFEEYGWDWAYHAFREWDGWSVEHGPDPNDHAPSETQTSREKLLRSWFARNRR
ncbi:MAG: glycoside hydrolase family 5 protein, partial [Armatimonadota bacterium]